MSVDAVNLFTNPWLVGSGSVEVRRSIWTDPIPTGTAMPNLQARWAATSGSQPQPTIDVQGWVRFDAAAASSDGTISRASNWGVNGLPVAASTTYTLSFEMEWKSGLRQPRVSRYEYTATGTGVGGRTITTIAQDATTGRWVVTFTTAATVERLVLILETPGDPISAGDWWRMRRTQLVASPVLTPYGDPVSGSGDPDLTAAWAGAANASATIFTGVPVAGIQANRVVAIRSAKFGGSMRLIPTDPANNDCSADLLIPSGPLVTGSAGGTAVATFHLEKPLTGALNGRSRQLTAFFNEQNSVKPPNLAGSYPIRLSFTTPLTGVARMRFNHGGLQGSGDVYWTAPGLFSGAYDGPTFTGADPAKDGYRYYWQGTPDASPSVRFRVLAPSSDMVPVPRILLDVVPSQFPPGAVTVSLTRTAEGRTFDVRGGQQLPAGSPAVVTDAEAPFGVESSYTVIGYDAEGNIVGSLPVGSVTLDCDLTVVQQPLDARLSASVERRDGWGSQLSRETPGEAIYPQGRVVASLVSLGPRRGLAGVNLDIACSRDQVEKLQASLGTYEVPQLPVWLVRTPPDDTGGTKLPAVFFCHVPALVELDTYRHTGAGLVHYQATVTEATPPAPGITATVLTHSDIKALFTTHTEVKAQYATHSDLKRDQSLIGAADA